MTSKNIIEIGAGIISPGGAVFAEHALPFGIGVVAAELADGVAAKVISRIRIPNVRLSLEHSGVESAGAQERVRRFHVDARCSFGVDGGGEWLEY